jgi:hypothetical protein
LIHKGLVSARFAEILSRINVQPQPTNLGVRSSNLFGRATLPLNGGFKIHDAKGLCEEARRLAKGHRQTVRSARQGKSVRV